MTGMTKKRFCLEVNSFRFKYDPCKLEGVKRYFPKTNKEILSDAANEIFGDLLLIQKQTYRMSKSMKPGNSEVGESPVGSLSASWHYTEGMFIWQGKGIGANHRFDSHIANIAPSLYAWLGIPIPAEVDGEPMLEMFRVPPEVDYRDVINYPNAFGKGKPSVPEERSAEEQEALQDQLESLGYL